MKSPILVRLAILTTVMVGIAAGAVTGLLFITRSTPAQSAVSILQKSEAAQTQMLAAFGPNTTLHGADEEYREQTDPGGLPHTTIGESFWAFDATGKLSAYSSVLKGTDGQIYQRSDLVGGALVDTDVVSGQTHTYPDYAPSPDSLRAAQSRVITALRARVTPSLTTKTTTVNGIAVFVIDTPDGHGGTNRNYIGQDDYWPLRSEQLAPDGHVTAYTMQTVLEVLPGIVTESP